MGQSDRPAPPGDLPAHCYVWVEPNPRSHSGHWQINPYEVLKYRHDISHGTEPPEETLNRLIPETPPEPEPEEDTMEEEAPKVPARTAEELLDEACLEHHDRAGQWPSNPERKFWRQKRRFPANAEELAQWQNDQFNRVALKVIGVILTLCVGALLLIGSWICW